MDARHLAKDEVLAVHHDQITRYGGEPGLRDEGLLISALAQAQQTFDGAPLHSSLCEMASAYLFHLVANHPFIDGNKRVGAVCSLLFLVFNDVEFSISEGALEHLTRDVAAGRTSKAEVAAFFEKHTRAL